MTVGHVFATMCGFVAGYWFCLLLDRRVRRWLSDVAEPKRNG